MKSNKDNKEYSEQDYASISDDYSNNDKIIDDQNYVINELIINRSIQLGLKQIDLIKQTGIKTSKMSKIFNKKLRPSLEDLEKLSIPLKLSKETLWVVSDYMLPPDKESKIEKEILELKRTIENLNKKSNEITQHIETNMKLTTKEIGFIEEYLEFIKYKRTKK